MIGVLHTTESDPGSGEAVDSYFRSRLLNGEDYRPHILYDPFDGYTKGYIIPPDYAKALHNAPGGVETNRRDGGVFQVEIVGYAADVGTYNDAWYANLRIFLQTWSAIQDIAYQFHVTPHRFTLDEWNDPGLRGWFGHCNVPENNHSDPGTLDYTRLTQALTTQGAPVAALEDVTPITIHPGGDRTKASQQTPLVSAIAYAVDASAQAEANTLQILAAIKLLQPVAPSIRTFTTAELLAELVRRQSA